MRIRSGRSPSARWSREHGFKIVHRWWIGAWWHAYKLNKVVSEPRHPYACHWGQWYYHGEVFKKHWHVGRSPAREDRTYR